MKSKFLLVALGLLVLGASAAYAFPPIDLTTAGATYTGADGVIWNQIITQPTGTGYIDPFLRVQKNDIEEGFLKRAMGGIEKSLRKLSEKGKLAVLKDAEKWSTNVGHPGPANPAEGEVFATFILPNMLANAARGMKAETAVEQAEFLVKRVFANWRKKGLVGGKS